MNQLIRNILKRYPHENFLSVGFSKILSKDEISKIKESIVIDNNNVIISSMQTLKSHDNQKRITLFVKEKYDIAGEGTRLIEMDQHFNANDFFEAYENLINSIMSQNIVNEYRRMIVEFQNAKNH